MISVCCYKERSTNVYSTPSVCIKDAALQKQKWNCIVGWKRSAFENFLPHEILLFLCCRRSVGRVYSVKWMLFYVSSLIHTQIHLLMKLTFHCLATCAFVYVKKENVPKLKSALKAQSKSETHNVCELPWTMLETIFPYAACCWWACYVIDILIKSKHLILTRERENSITDDSQLDRTW